MPASTDAVATSPTRPTCPPAIAPTPSGRRPGLAWARTISPDAGTLAEKLLESRPHPEHAYRSCLGLMSLTRRYGTDRVGAACTRALRCGAISYTSVKSILAEGLDQVPLREAEQLPSPPEHENLRGARYYAEEA